MDDKDTRQAAAALARWFQSQQIGKGDAAGIMVALIGSILAETAASDLELIGAMAAFSSDLADAIKAHTARIKAESRGRKSKK